MPLFGRTAHLDRLRDTTTTRRLFIQGGDGVGKSALISAYADEVRDGGGVAVIFRPLGLTNGITPLATIVARLLAAQGKVSGKHAKAVLKGIAAETRDDAGRSFLADVAELPEAPSGLEAQRPAKTVPEAARMAGRERCLRRLLTLLRDHGVERLLLAVEHLECLREDVSRVLLRWAGDAPEGFQFVATIGQVGMRAKWATRQVLSSFGDDLMNLANINAEDVHAWLRQEGWNLEGRDAREVYRGTEGNPGKVMRLLRRRERLGEIAAPEVAKVVSITQIVEEYPPDLRKFVRQVSVLNRPLDIERYSVLTGCPAVDVSGFVERLQGDGIWSRIMEQPWFSSVSVHQEVYQTILPNLLKRYHEGAVKLLEQDQRDALESPRADDLPVKDAYARHLYKAMDYRRSVTWNLRVAEEHLAVGGLLAAHSALLRAEESGNVIGYEDEMRGIRGDAAFVGSLLGLHDESYRVHRDLLDGYRNDGDRGNQVNAYLGMGIAAFGQGRDEEAKGALKAALELGKEVLPAPVAARVRLLLVYVRLRLREVEEARELVRHLQDHDDSSLTPQMHLIEGSLQLLEGDVSKSADTFRQATRSTDASATPEDVFFATYASALAQVSADPGAVHDLVDPVQQAAQDAGSGVAMALAAFLRGMSQLQRGDARAATETFKEVERRARGNGLDRLLGLSCSYRAGMEQGLGHGPKAREMAQQALELLPFSQFPVLHGLGRVMLGEMAGERGKVQELQREFDSASEILTAQGGGGFPAEIALRRALTVFNAGETPRSEDLQRARQGFRELDREQRRQIANLVARLATGSLKPQEYVNAHEPEIPLEATLPESEEFTIASFNRALVLATLGRRDDARSALVQGLSTARNNGLQALVDVGTLVEGVLALLDGEATAALDHLARVRERATESDRPHLAGEAALFEATARVLSGDQEGARAALQDAEKYLKRSGRQFRLEAIPSLAILIDGGATSGGDGRRSLDQDVEEETTDVHRHEESILVAWERRREGKPHEALELLRPCLDQDDLAPAILGAALFEGIAAARDARRYRVATDYLKRLEALGGDDHRDLAATVATALRHELGAQLFERYMSM